MQLRIQDCQEEAMCICLIAGGWGIPWTTDIFEDGICVENELAVSSVIGNVKTHLKGGTSKLGSNFSNTRTLSSWRYFKFFYLFKLAHYRWHDIVAEIANVSRGYDREVRGQDPVMSWERCNLYSPRSTLLCLIYVSCPIWIRAQNTAIMFLSPSVNIFLTVHPTNSIFMHPSPQCSVLHTNKFSRGSRVWDTCRVCDIWVYEFLHAKSHCYYTIYTIVASFLTWTKSVCSGLISRRTFVEDI